MHCPLTPAPVVSGACTNELIVFISWGIATRHLFWYENLILGAAEQPLLPYSAASNTPRMTRQFLVPMDDSEQARNALRHALELFSDAEITVVHVIDSVEAAYSGEANTGGYDSNSQEITDTQAKTVFESAQTVADEFERTVMTTVAEGRPAKAIVEFVEDEEFDGVIMGSQGRSGVSRVLLGSVAETVVRQSSVPVTVVR